MEAFTSATNVRSVDNVIEDLGMSIENGVHEANWAFADGDSLLIELDSC